MTPEIPHIPESGITDGKLLRVPNQPKTPHKSFRIPDDLYSAALAIAKENGETLTEVVRLALQQYVERSRYGSESPAGDGESE